MKSMTGFGSAQARLGDVELTVEVRSVNQRHLDVKLNVPREYGAWEAALRREVGEHIGRGRVEVFFGRSVAARAHRITLQKDIAAAYLKVWRQLKHEFDLPGEIDLSLLQGRSEIFQRTDQGCDPEREMELVEKLLQRALRAHAREREREGAHLRRDLDARTKSLLQLTRKMRLRSTKLGPQFRERVQKRVTGLLGGATVDPLRLVQEAALLAERADVTEELVRLESHLGALRDLLKSTDSVGKRMDFVLQEINRELNTIGSKANDLQMTNLVVDGKSEMEKIREQVQNIE